MTKKSTRILGGALILTGISLISQSLIHIPSVPHIKEAKPFPSIPMPASGDEVVVTGFENDICNAIPGNLDGDDIIDWVGKTNIRKSKTLLLEGVTGLNKHLWTFNTNIPSKWTQDGWGQHECAIPWDMDLDGKDEVMTVRLEGEIDPYVIVLNGQTGEIKGRLRLPAGGGISSGGVTPDTPEGMGNHYACIAYLDGPNGKPYLCIAQGIYWFGAVWTFYWDDQKDKLVHKWTYQNDDEEGVSWHGMSCYDLNMDGRDEVIFGGTIINPDGTKYWSLLDLRGQGHVDIAAPGDHVPSNSGPEIYFMTERPNGMQSNYVMMVSGDGKILWEKKGTHVDQGWCANVDDTRPGNESRAKEKYQNGIDALFDSNGNIIEGGTKDTHSPVEWTGDNVYETNLVKGFRYGADLGGGPGHGAEEIVNHPGFDGGKVIHIKFNKTAKQYPSRWQNRHYRQDVVTVGAGYSAEHLTFQVVNDEPAVKTKPVIYQHPQNTTIKARENATFSVAPWGTSPLTCKWQENTANGWRDIPGAVNFTFTTAEKARKDNKTQYRCVVKNDLGTEKSDPAILTVMVITDGFKIKSSSDTVYLSKNQTAQVTCTVPREDHVVLNVYTNECRFVKELKSIDIKKGDTSFDWNCTDANGKIVSPGIYFIQAKYPDTPGFMRKFILI